MTTSSRKPAVGIEPTTARAQETPTHRDSVALPNVSAQAGPSQAASEGENPPRNDNETTTAPAPAGAPDGRAVVAGDEELDTLLAMLDAMAEVDAKHADASVVPAALAAQRTIRLFTKLNPVTAAATVRGLAEAVERLRADAERGESMWAVQHVVTGVLYAVRHAPDVCERVIAGNFPLVAHAQYRVVPVRVTTAAPGGDAARAGEGGPV